MDAAFAGPFSETTFSVVLVRTLLANGESSVAQIRQRVRMSQLLELAIQRATDRLTQALAISTANFDHVYHPAGHWPSDLFQGFVIRQTSLNKICRVEPANRGAR